MTITTTRQHVPGIDAHIYIDEYDGTYIYHDMFGYRTYKTLRGLVLREVKYKESSKILTFLTEEEGKITAEAKGVLRKGARSAASAQMLVWSELTFSEYRGRYTLTEGNVLEDFSALREDIADFALGYYFAELLSILEMPRHEDWKVDIVSAVWDNDPVLINNGIIQISDNNWFVGTINNDDSTFAVADKVYDRAVPIDLDSRADPFECELTEPVHITTDYLSDLFYQAREEHPLSQEMEDKLDELNIYLITNFRLAFGNRIIKQMRDFVPVFVACGGTEVQAVDFMVAKKVLRKFESLSLGFMKDQLSKMQQYLDREFGRDRMITCKNYIEFLKKNN